MVHSHLRDALVVALFNRHNCLRCDAMWTAQVYGPTADNGYGTDVFPALRDALSLVVKSETIRQSTGRGTGPTNEDWGDFLRRELTESLWRSKKRSAPGLGGSDGGWERVQHEIHRVARAVVRVANVLVGALH